MWLCVGMAQTRIEPSAAPPQQSLAECRQRIAISAPRIDADCLRRIYALPINEWPAPTVDAGASWQELAPLPDVPPAPADNPQTPDKIALGKRLCGRFGTTTSLGRRHAGQTAIGM